MTETYRPPLQLGPCRRCKRGRGLLLSTVRRTPSRLPLACRLSTYGRQRHFGSCPVYQGCQVPNDRLSPCIHYRKTGAWGQRHYIHDSHVVSCTVASEFGGKRKSSRSPRKARRLDSLMSATLPLSRFITPADHHCSTLPGDNLDVGRVHRTSLRRRCLQPT